MNREYQHRIEGVTVTGSGSAAASVDVVTLTVGVEIVRPDAGEAFSTASSTVTTMLTVLSDNGVDARSVRTANLTLGPRTEYRDGRDVLLGYAASQRMIVHLQALDTIEHILSEVAARGGDGVRIDGVALSAGNPQWAHQHAREAAFADAVGKAQQYASLAGRNLGPVQEVSEALTESGRMYGGALRMAADASMPVSTGDTEVNATVQVRWGFADGPGEMHSV